MCARRARRPAAERGSVQARLCRYRHSLAERSHEPTRQRERTMRGFKSMGQAQRFLTVHGTMKNLFAIPQHLMRAKHYRLFRTEALDMYQQVTCA